MHQGANLDLPEVERKSVHNPLELQHLSQRLTEGEVDVQC